MNSFAGIFLTIKIIRTSVKNCLVIFNYLLIVYKSYLHKYVWKILKQNVFIIKTIL